MSKKSWSAPYLSAFFMELALMLEAGIPLRDGAFLLEEEEQQRGAKPLLHALGEKLEEGSPLSEAMEAAGCFPRYAEKMVRLGEATGRLEETLRGLSDYYEEQDQLEKSVRSAVTYPAVLLALMLAVLVILVVKVLPIFQDVYRQLGVEMSPAAQGLLGAGRLLGQYGWFVLGGLALLAAGVWLFLLLRRGSGRPSLWGGWGVGAAVASARFASAMAMGMKSGLELEDALELAESVAGSQELSEKVEHCRQRLVKGDGFAESLAASEIFSPVDSRMLAVGVQAGAADTVMEKLARRSGEAARERIESAVGRLEPTMVLVMSVLVGLILLAVLLPLLGILATLG